MIMATKNVETIEIKPIKIVKTNIRIVGDTPLIMHAWSEKAKREMLDKQMKKTKTSSRSAKNPMEDFIRSMYWLTPMPTDMSEKGFIKAINDGAKFGFPVTGIKQAAISAAYRMGWSKDKASLRGVFFIDGDENQMVEIHSDTPVMREDMVKINMAKTADIRYRGEFRNWYADLTISYNANGQYTIEQVVNIINAGGYVCGLGEWRPERDGQYGMFHVEAISN
jgi:hypothetical protein